MQFVFGDVHLRLLGACIARLVGVGEESLGVTVATKNRRSTRITDSRPPSAADNVPPPFPREDHGFEFQALFDLKQSIGELKTSMEALTASVNSTKTKVEDLVNWKNKILGGAIALGAVTTLLGFVFAKLSNYVTIAAPQPALPQPPVMYVPVKPQAESGEPATAPPATPPSGNRPQH